MSISTGNALELFYIFTIIWYLFLNLTLFSYVIFQRHYNVIFHIQYAVYYILMAPVFYHWKLVPLIPFTSFAPLLPPQGQPSVISL